MQTLNIAPESASDQPTRARIRDEAIEQFGQQGFGAELSAIVDDPLARLLNLLSRKMSNRR